MISIEKKSFFRYENFMLVFMFIAFGLVFMDRFGLAMLFPMIAPDLKLSGAQMGMTMSILSLSWGVSSYLFATLSDIFGSKKKILVGAILVFSFATMGTGLASSIGLLFLMRAIMGVAEGPAIVLSQVSMMAASTPSRKGFNIGFVQSASHLMGTAVAAVIVLGSAQLFGWRGALNVLAIPGIIVGLILIVFMKEPIMDSASGAKKKPTKAEYAQVFKSGNFWLCVTMTLGMMAWWLTSNTFFALYLTKSNHFTPLQLGTFFTVYGLACFSSNILVPFLSDKIGRKPACIMATFCCVLSTIVMLTVHSFNILVPLMGIILVIGAGGTPVFAAIIPGESVPKALVATAMGFIIMTGELVAGTTVPVLAGFFSDKYGLSMTMWFAFGGAVLQFIPSLFLKETLPSKIKKTQQTNQVESAKA
ncbi:MAG: hypothetical protein APF81_21495 [Desulfosporosinus sp. BRH_c37]|nr:MAG: hypothetical protein APF81_21495 [Desulfosporosinus sp. BRH_c37]